ncbi:MAG: winged helix DNA-binding protein [Pseudomonadota bacterium]
MADSDPIELAFQTDRLMRRVNAGISQRAPHFDPERIGPIGGMILLTIAEVQPVPLQAVADLMARDKAQLSRAISSLERRDYLRKVPNCQDQRSSLLSLTAKGEALVAEIKKELSRVLDDIFAPLTSEQRDQMLALLKML